MNIFKRISGTVLMMLYFVLVAAPSDCDLDVYMRVFKIPRIQNWETKLFLIKPLLCLNIKSF